MAEILSQSNGEGVLSQGITNSMVFHLGAIKFNKLYLSNNAYRASAYSSFSIDSHKVGSTLQHMAIQNTTNAFANV